jgi:hypothetical protein
MELKSISLPSEGVMCAGDVFASPGNQRRAGSRRNLSVFTRLRREPSRSFLFSYFSLVFADGVRHDKGMKDTWGIMGGQIRIYRKGQTA